MKILFRYLLPFLFLFEIETAIAQCTPICNLPSVFKVDISTGIDGNGQFIPPLTKDDDWQIKLPNTGYYQDVFCSNNQNMNGGIAGVYAQLSWYSSARFISPALDQSGYMIDAPGEINCTGCGVYYYRMQFNLSPSTMCNPQAATLVFNLVGGDNTLDMIQVNTMQHTVAYNFFQINNNPGFFPFTVNSSITLGPTELNWNGLNEIIVRVTNSTEYTGLIINGYLSIPVTDQVKFNFRDENGIKKSEFCLGKEDVFLDASDVSGSGYFIEVSTVNGTNVTPVAYQNVNGWSGGFPAFVNITDIMRANNVTFSPGTYRVTFRKNSLCGVLESVKDFEYVCCESPPDATFDLSINSSLQLTGSSEVSGAHLWTVYSMPKGKAVPYERILLSNTDDKSFVLDNPSPCYYVEHKMMNACGWACSAQSICNFDCTDLVCIVNTPVVQYNQNTHVFSWPAVTNAQSYVIEITVNDCPNCPHPLVVGMSDFKTKTIQGGQGGTVSYTLDADLYGWEAANPCFRWIVYAVCADGTRSAPATGCSN